jgi:hypothetical protein
MTDFTISYPAPDYPNWGSIIATVSDSSGGAIKSLKWANILARGGVSKEYVDAKDHGRFIQSSWSNDGANSEVYNPTEGGSSSDLMGNLLSSSKLISAYPGGSNILNTRTQLAFWKDVDRLRVSPFILDKTITLGWNGVWNLIKIHETLYLPRGVSFTLSQWEKLTAYLPSEFSVFETFNKTTGVISPLSDTPAGEQSFPLVFSTPDAAWAMAMYAPDANPGGGYGRWRFSDCVKMNAVSRIQNPAAGAVLVADTFIAIGDRAGAVGSLKNLTAV